MKIVNFFFALLFVMAVLNGFAKGPFNPGTGDVKGIDRSNMDTTVSPAKDFFLYANGGWLKKNPIPATESAWGLYSYVQDVNYKSLLQVMKDAAAESATTKDPKIQKVGDFYISAMDTNTIEKLGAKPLQPELDRINNIKDIKGLMEVITLYQVYGISPAFGFFGDQDQKDSKSVVPYLYQGGIGLPDRDYYFNKGKEPENIRKEYVKHVAAMLKLLGEDSKTSKKHAQTIMDLETNLAQASMTAVQQRDPYNIYHKMSIAEVSALTPNIDWNAFLAALNVKGATYFVVGQPDFLKEVNKQLLKTNLDDWKTYLRWHLVSALAGQLSNDFVKEHFHFYGNILAGTPEMMPRWKRVVREADGDLGELLGEVYVSKHFSPDAKARTLEMVNNLIAVYRIRINNLDWMNAETKKKANEKLDLLMKKIGYPDIWRDYSSLKIDKSSYFNNVVQSNIFAFNYMANKIGKPVVRTDWGMTPQTVNAYYNPTMNEIVFPAGILQYPLFDPSFDDAVNYGNTGATIGHEMTHGFDDQGCQYDADGNLKNWWTKDDSTNFANRAKLLVKEFNESVVFDTIHINGELTLGENIADLGGLLIAYQAFKNTEEGRTNPTIDGFTADQRFFIAYAQSWAGQKRREALIEQILTNPHAPDNLRGNNPLSNIPEFYKAFNIKPGDKMYRNENDRVKIW